MSGGGRCNFTNLHSTPDNFISSNPHFCKSALSRFTQWDFIALVEQHRIPYHEKTLGQLFCDRSSKDIVAMLKAECDAAGVHILMKCEDTSITTGFEIACNRGGWSADAVIVASGGLSIPRMGASDFGYRIARQFGHQIVETRAGLVPFTFTGQLQDAFTRLAGVSCEAEISVRSSSFREQLLFTHRGMSGPATLQSSSYWQPGDDIYIDLLPGLDTGQLLLNAKRRQPQQRVRTIIGERLRAPSSTNCRRFSGGRTATQRSAKSATSSCTTSVLRCTRGRFDLPRPRAIAPPRSRLEESTPPSCRHGRWKVNGKRSCISSASWSMSVASSADTISNGPGHRAGRRDRPCKALLSLRQQS